MESLRHDQPSIFELAGKRNSQEVKALIASVAQILTEETKAGRNKLGRNIDETRTSKNGQEYFVDGKIAYLPSKGDAIFIGDTHGDSLSTESIIRQIEFIEAMKSGAKDIVLVFLGDYADRGKNDVRNLEIILALKERYPNNVILNRGNHEERETSRYYGLLDSLQSHFSAKEGELVFTKYHKLFEQLPNIVITGNGIVAVHGGITIADIHSLQELRDNESSFEQIRWNDPTHDTENVQPNNDRGDFYKFGYKPFEKFMKSIGGKVMVRSHEYPRDGFELFFGNRLVTIFSNGGESNESRYSGRVQPKILHVSLVNPISEITPQNLLDLKYPQLSVSHLASD